MDGARLLCLIDGKVVALINRRVAAINGCEFREDINAAASSELGVSDEMEYADRISINAQGVDDELFSRWRRFCDEDAMVQLIAAIAWEKTPRASSTRRCAYRRSAPPQTQRGSNRVADI